MRSLLRSTGILVLFLSAFADVTVAQTAPANSARLVNLSVRTQAGSGADTLIVGFNLAGSGAKPLLLRGVGPALTPFGVNGALADPTLRLDILNGSLVAQNDNWDATIAPVAASVGAFALPAASRDAALLPTLAAGSYTAQVGGGSGVALVELYDTAAGSGPALANVSARTRSGAGGDVLIAGFGISGTGTKTLLVRAVGPGLVPFGVDGTLADPQLAIFSGASQIAANDNWGNSAALATAATQVGAFALPAGSRDAALLINLPPGSYTAQITGANNSAGIVLIEVYDVPESAAPNVPPLLELFATESSFPARLFRVSPATGLATAVSSISFFPGLEFRRNGTLYGAGSSLATLSPQNGAATTLGQLPELLVSIAFAPDDTLYGVSNGGRTLYRLDPATGRALASVPITGTTHPSGAVFGGEINAIEVGPDGTLYGIGFSLYTLNPATGVATKISTTNRAVSGQLYSSLDFGPDGILRAATGVVDANASSDLYTVDIATGVGTLVGSSGFRLGGLASRTFTTTSASVSASPAPLRSAGADAIDSATFAEVLRACLARIHAAEADRVAHQR